MKRIELEIFASAVAMITFLALGLVNLDVIKSHLFIALSTIATLLLIQQLSKGAANNTKK